MKVLCSACEAAEARVLCCADEAALCARCDRDVHAANRLAGKHHRLPLLHPPAFGAAAASAASPATAAAATPPSCDICQESSAYFFCVEDRALLCRSCDVAVHTANAFVSAHRRFLLTGVQVGLQPDATSHDQDPLQGPSSAAAAPAPAAPLPTPPAAAPAKKARGSPAPPLYSDDDVDWAAGGGGADAGVAGDLLDWPLVEEQFGAPEPMVTRTPSKRGLAAAFAVQGGLAGGMPDWPLEEFFGFSDFNGGLSFTENGTSKADSGKLGSTDGSPTGRSSSGSAQEFFGQVPEFHQWSVPELPSPPTASGLHWQGGPRHGGAVTDTAAVSVPDISSPENPFRCFPADAGQPQPAPAKRRRRC